MDLRNYYDTFWQRTEKGKGELNYTDRASQVKIKTVLGAIKKGKRVLDYGSGDGQHASLIQKHCAAEVVGVDISPKAVEMARRRNPTIAFHAIQDGKPLPFENGTFDVVFAGDVIEHLLDVDSVVGEWGRVIKEGGLLIVTTPYHGFVKNLVITLTCFGRHFNPRDQHIRFFTVQTLKTCLEAAGFQMTDVKYRGRVYPFSSGMMIFARKDRDAVPSA